MKIAKIMILLCLASLLFVSCDQNIDTTGTAETSSVEVSTKYPSASMPNVTTSEKTETETSSTAQTEKEIFIIPDVPVSEYMDDFESFMNFPIGRFTSELYHDKSKLKPNHLQGSGAIRFVVEGIEMYTKTVTTYRVRILEIYGWDADLDTEKVYLLGYRGTPERPLHDRPALQIGKEYLRLGQTDLGSSVIQMTMALPLEYTTAGKAYVYGYGFDFSLLSCAIVITDEAENQIFKLGIHDKYIEYAKENNIVLPTFDYKCELDSFLRELGV